MTCSWHAAKRAGCGLAFAWLSGCAVQTTALRSRPPSDLPGAAELSATPFFAQTAYQCGPAALATALAAIGIDAAPAWLAAFVAAMSVAGTVIGSIRARLRLQAIRAGAASCP